MTLEQRWKRLGSRVQFSWLRLMEDRREQQDSIRAEDSWIKGQCKDSVIGQAHHRWMGQINHKFRLVQKTSGVKMRSDLDLPNLIHWACLPLSFSVSIFFSSAAGMAILLHRVWCNEDMLITWNSSYLERDKAGLQYLLKILFLEVNIFIVKALI